MKEDKETSRLEAFSDGVFAVAITLLVLNIKIPTVDSPGNLLGDSQLWSALIRQSSTLVAYAISFFTIGIMWLNHHRLFKYIKHTNTGLMLLNLLLLAIIVFIPVPTALLAAYAFSPNQHVAAIIYSGTCAMMAVCYNLLWRYAAYHNRLLGKDVDTRAVKAISQQYIFGPVFYLVSVGLALVSPPASIALNFALALFFALPPRLPRQGAQEEAQERMLLDG